MSFTFASIKRFLTRLMIYYVILLWTYVRYENIQNNAEEVQKRLNRTFGFLGLKDQFFVDIVTDPSLMLFILCCAEGISGMFGLFGSFYGNILSAALFSFVSFVIYFFPLLPENAISLYYTRSEIVMNLGILLALLMVTFYPYKPEVEHISYKSVDHIILEGLPRNPHIPQKEGKKTKKH